MERTKFGQQKLINGPKKTVNMDTVQCLLEELGSGEGGVWVRGQLTFTQKW